MNSYISINSTSPSTLPLNLDTQKDQENTKKTSTRTVRKNKNFDIIVAKNQNLVKRIANHLASKMPASIQVDDLVQSGMVGLLEAASKYDEEKGASFETFAGIRIRGAMLDEIRRGDWGPRSVYRNSRRVADVIRQLKIRLGRDARDFEIANELEVTIGEFYKMVSDLKGCRLFSYEELFNSEDSKLQARSGDYGPLIGVEDDKFKSDFHKALNQLPEREKLVLNLYYDDEMNLKQIGQILNVSESRVSQIHSQATLKLRSKLQSWIK